MNQCPISMNDDRIDLNDYHKRQSKRLVKEVSEQPLLSPEAFIEQTKRLRSRSRKQPTSVGK